MSDWKPRPDLDRPPVYVWELPDGSLVEDTNPIEAGAIHRARVTEPDEWTVYDPEIGAWVLCTPAGCSVIHRTPVEHPWKTALTPETAPRPAASCSVADLPSSSSVARR